MSRIIYKTRSFRKSMVYLILFIMLHGMVYAKSNYVNCDSLYANQNILTLDTILKKPSEVVLTPQYGVLDGTWSPASFLSCIDCQTPTAYPERTILYTVKLIDENQCTHLESFRIELELTVPNVITPNGDSYNDCLKIAGLPNETPMKIYDKNGILVFSTNTYDNSNCWTGTDNNGDPLEVGTYWYVLDNSLSGVYKKGFVLLIR
jgi:gliding motility-associated-like protein